MGQKRAVLIATNYSNSSPQTQSCINDTANLSLWLQLHLGFNKSDIMNMTSTPGVNTLLRPTRDNIIKAIQWLIQDAKPDDLLFLSFSSFENCICDFTDHPIDDKTSIIHVLKNEISSVFDSFIYNLLLNCQAKLVCIFDCEMPEEIFQLKSSNNLVVFGSRNSDNKLILNLLKCLTKSPNSSIKDINNQINDIEIQVGESINITSPLL